MKKSSVLKVVSKLNPKATLYLHFLIFSILHIIDFIDYFQVEDYTPHEKFIELLCFMCVVYYFI